MRLTTFLISLLFVFQAQAGDFIIKQKYGGMQFLKAIAGVQVVDQYERRQLIKVSVPESKEGMAVLQLLSNPQVEYVVRDFKLKAFRTPLTINGLKEQWAIAKVRAEEAWAKAGNRGSKKIVVAVIDTGMDYKHEALSPNSVPGYDFRQNDSDPMDETSSKNPGHGTHCGGIIGASGLVDGGTIGMSPEVSLMPIRFLGADGSGDLMGGIKSIDYAIEKGAHIISASWGATVGRAQAKPLIEAVQRADDAGVIFIAAAANDGRSNDTTDVFPANANTPNMITVAASGPSDEKPSWSNYGKENVHLASPGLNIMSTLPNDKYGNLSGTSMATPLVAGLVAFLKAQDESLTGMQVKALLQTTGVKANIETACNCRIDAAAAVEALLEKKQYMVPTAMTLRPSETQQFSVVNGTTSLKFESSNAQVATVTEAGLLTAKAEGETQVIAKDAEGKVVVQSLAIRVAKKGSGGGGTQPPGGGMPTECPFEPQMCQIMCQIMPDMPWCKSNTN